MAFRYTNSPLIMCDAPEKVIEVNQLEQIITERKDEERQLVKRLSELNTTIAKRRQTLIKTEESLQTKLSRNKQLEEAYSILLANRTQLQTKEEQQKQKIAALEAKQCRLADMYVIWQEMEQQLEGWKKAQLVLHQSSCLTSPLTRHIQQQQTLKDIDKYIYSLIMYKQTVFQMSLATIEDANILILPSDLYSIIFYYLDLGTLTKLARTCKYLYKQFKTYVVNPNSSLFYIRTLLLERRIYVPLSVSQEKVVKINELVKLFQIQDSNHHLIATIPYINGTITGLTMLYTNECYKGYITQEEGNLTGPLVWYNDKEEMYLLLFRNGAQYIGYHYDKEGNIISSFVNDDDPPFLVNWPCFLLPAKSIKSWLDTLLIGSWNLLITL